jgi:hypothetical protein
MGARKLACVAPNLQLLCKLSSIVAHATEALGKDAHHFDMIALRQLLDDGQVKAWMAEMLKHGLAAVARSPGTITDGN